MTLNKFINDDLIFQEFCRNTRLAIIVVDENEIVRFFNQGATNLLGYPNSQAIGSRVSELMIPLEIMDSPTHLKYIKDFLRGRQQRTIGNGMSLVKARRKDNSIIPVEISVFRLEVEETVYIASILSNVSDRVKKDKKLQAQNQELIITKNKLEETNNYLEVEKDRAEFNLSRAQTQDKLALSMLFSVVTIVTIVIGTSTFTRVQESVVNFSKDAALLLIGNLGGAVSALYGVRKLDETISKPTKKSKKEPEE